jgi:hypothetical protein
MAADSAADTAALDLTEQLAAARLLVRMILRTTLISRIS